MPAAEQIWNQEQLVKSIWCASSTWRRQDVNFHQVWSMDHIREKMGVNEGRIWQRAPPRIVSKMNRLISLSSQGLSRDQIRLWIEFLIPWKRRDATQSAVERRHFGIIGNSSQNALLKATFLSKIRILQIRRAFLKPLESRNSELTVYAFSTLPLLLPFLVFVVESLSLPSRCLLPRPTVTSKWVLMKLVHSNERDPFGSESLIGEMHFEGSGWHLLGFFRT